MLVVANYPRRAGTKRCPAGLSLRRHLKIPRRRPEVHCSTRWPTGAPALLLHALSSRLAGSPPLLLALRGRTVPRIPCSSRREAGTAVLSLLRVKEQRGDWSWTEKEQQRRDSSPPPAVRHRRAAWPRGPLATPPHKPVARATRRAAALPPRARLD
jgi:hypothetical protein